MLLSIYGLTLYTIDVVFHLRTHTIPAIPSRTFHYSLWKCFSYSVDTSGLLFIPEFMIYSTHDSAPGLTLMDWSHCYIFISLL